MCGIAGILKLDGSTTAEDRAAVRRMMDAQIHRGPDGEGIISLGVRGEGLGETDNIASRLTPHASRSSVVLGHRRLSIIDLSPAGKQPMSNEDGTVWVTYNGEIYNFRELREELNGRGHVFKSQTDTEALVHGYEEWGIEGLLPRLRGMFAFALWDSSRSKLFLAKDRFGIKPLYYYQDHENLIFASEVRAVMKSGMVPDEKSLEALIYFLQLGSVPVPLTTIKNVFALPAGHYLELNQKGASLKRYWDLSTYLNQSPSAAIHIDEVVATTRSLLEDSVKDHLISDVPLGVFLSGGIDSSALVALATRFGGKPLTTLSIVFDEPDYSEAQYARLVAKKYGTDHREVLLRSKDFFDELPRIFEAMDQPTIDGVNSYFVSKAAKEAGLTVVLSGTGGDEVFLGYEHFKKTGRLERTRRFLNLFPLRMRQALIRGAILAGLPSGAAGREKLAYLDVPTDENYYLLFRGLFTPRQIQELLGIGEQELKPFLSRPPASSSLLDSFTLFEFGHYLQNQLLKDTDVMSMAHSVETRVPFLDHRLVEFAAGIRRTLMLGDGMNKPLLVKAMGDDLPREVWDRPKMGFTFPFGDWMKKRTDELEAENLERETFDRKAASKVWDGFRKGRVHWSRPWGMALASRAFDYSVMENVLIYRTGQLGDTICAMPAIQAVRDHFAPCRLVLMSDVHPGKIYPMAHEVLSDFKMIDDYLVYSPEQVFSVSDAFNLRRQIMQRKIKRMVYLSQRHRTQGQRVRDFIFFKSCGIRQLYGLGLFGNRNRVSNGKHEVDRIMDILRLENIPVPKQISWNLPVPERVKFGIDKMWAESGLDLRAAIAIGSGSKMPVKRWDLENYRVVGEKLINRYGVQLIIMGGAEDAESAEVLCKAWGSNGINMAGKTSYAKSAEILRRCVMYLGNDSGTMHLAAAVGTPCVAIFSARDEVGAWYPYGKQHIVLRKEVECQGCMLTECIEQKMKCIRSISVNEVLAACEEVLVSLGMGEQVMTSE